MASTPEQTRKIQRLRELFLLLDPNESALSDAEIEEKKKLMEKMKYIETCVKKQGEYYRMPSQSTRFNFQTVSSKFMHLLRECVLSHQWPEALDLVRSQCHEISRANSVIWKVGLAGLYQDSEKNGRLIEQFVNHVCLLGQLNIVEVLLDFLLFLLSQGQIEEAENLIMVLKKNDHFGKVVKNKKRSMANTLFFAYQGLAFHVRWKLAIIKTSKDEDDAHFQGSQVDEISRRMTQHHLGAETAQDIAIKAVKYLSSVKDIPGVWDIFITRLVEIHEYYGEVEDARNILVSYRKTNPKNPNAHRYMFEFESRHGRDEVVLMQCLQGIIELDTCNPLCVTLYHLKEKNDNPGAVTLLFDYLDYFHCKQDEKVWQLLADKLKNYNSHNLDDELKQCWEVRRNWWPRYMFKDLGKKKFAAELSQPGTLLWNKRVVQEALLQLDEPLKEEKKKKKRTTLDSGSSPDEPLKEEKKKKKKKRTTLDFESSSDEPLKKEEKKKRKRTTLDFGSSPASKRLKLENPE